MSFRFVKECIQEYFFEMAKEKCVSKNVRSYKLIDEFDSLINFEFSKLKTSKSKDNIIEQIKIESGNIVEDFVNLFGDKSPNFDKIMFINFLANIEKTEILWNELEKSSNCF